MPSVEGPKRKGTKESKAQNLLRRFPVFDLAQAVALNGSLRRTFLNRFVQTFTTLSYVPTRDAAPMIYGAQKPLFEVPPEPWSAIERHLRTKTRPDILEMNLTASRHLFDLVRSQNYIATECDSQVLRVRLKQVVAIGLDFYVTEGDRLIFQFPQVRKECLSDRASYILGSIVHHTYAQGDFSGAEIEIADVSCLSKGNERVPRIRSIPTSSILNRAALTEQIEEVYEILRELAEPSSSLPS